MRRRLTRATAWKWLACGSRPRSRCACTSRDFQRDSARVDYESFDVATHLGLDAKGHVTGLDGTPSTIKILANPVASLDLAAIAEQFGREDAAGRAPGVLGANAATIFKTTRPLQFEGGAKVPAGSYTLWLIPGTGAGTFIINSETASGGRNTRCPAT